MYPSFVVVDSYVGAGTGTGKIGPSGRKSTVNPICTFIDDAVYFDISISILVKQNKFD